MSQDPLSDLLRSVRVRGAVFYYVSCRDQWSAEAPPAVEIAEAVMPGCEHVMEYHMIAKGNGWAAVSGAVAIACVISPSSRSIFCSSGPALRASGKPAFLFLTAPVAAHAIGRAGYRRGSPLWKGTIADELAAAEKEAGPWTR